MKSEKPVKQWTYWRAAEEIKETRGTKRSEVDLLKEEDRSMQIAGRPS